MKRQRNAYERNGLTPRKGRFLNVKAPESGQDVAISLPGKGIFLPQKQPSQQEETVNYPDKPGRAYGGKGASSARHPSAISGSPQTVFAEKNRPLADCFCKTCPQRLSLQHVQPKRSR
ncbi:MAG: hypothetical protein IJ196_05535 [Prevotella sp.]|nr:hypothetical protein [Prevotella sp.]